MTSSKVYAWGALALSAALGLSACSSASPSASSASSSASGVSATSSAATASVSASASASASSTASASASSSASSTAAANATGDIKPQYHSSVELGEYADAPLGLTTKEDGSWVLKQATGDIMATNADGSWTIINSSYDIVRTNGTRANDKIVVKADKSWTYSNPAGYYVEAAADGTYTASENGKATTSLVYLPTRIATSPNIPGKKLAQQVTAVQAKTANGPSTQKAAEPAAPAPSARSQKHSGTIEARVSTSGVAGTVTNHGNQETGKVAIQGEWSETLESSTLTKGYELAAHLPYEATDQVISCSIYINGTLVAHSENAGRTANVRCALDRSQIG